MQDRIVELETRLSYQEAALETLSAELARQQRLVEQLQSAVRALAQRMPAPSDGAARGSAEEELPPHY